MSAFWQESSPGVLKLPSGRRGRVSKVASARRRPARTLAALSGSPRYIQYRGDPPPCDRTHRTPPGLPSGQTTPLSTHALVRGRGLRRPPPGGPVPAYAVHLLGRRPPEVPWESVWLRWPDFRLPADPDAARAVLTEAWERAAVERVEVACGGGRGRTGTALAVLAVLDGVPAGEAVAYVRRHYDRHAVETPWQRRYVRRFTG